jgi:hypothetical protein
MGPDAPVRVFLSHAWTDRSPPRVAENARRGLAQRMRDALRAAGADVFFDDDGIDDLEDIETRIRDVLAACTLLVCWYSDMYRERRACHWELLAAVTTDPSRVVVVNPEPGLDHILPASLRNVLVPPVPAADDEPAWEALATRIVGLARAKGGTFGPPRADETRWYGDPPARFARFVGRAEELWELDSLLRPPHPLSGGDPEAAAVVVHGLGGVGKTALAFEYAARFAGAYPGGIVWLRAQADEASPDVEAQLEGRRAGEFLLLAAQFEPSPPDLESSTAGRSVEDAEAIIRRHLADGDHLWLIDDLPAGLPADVFRRWLPPGGRGRVLVTTRGTTYRHVPNLALGVLAPGDAVELLQSAGSDVGDRDTAEALADRLGNLPLALEVVGALASLPGASPAALLAELHDPLALVERAADNPFASASATEHPLSVAETFGPSLRRLDADSIAVLTVAAALNVGPLPAAVVQPVAESLAGIDTGSFATAIGMLFSRSLARRVNTEAFEVHALVAGATLQWTAASDDFRRACFDAAAHYVVLDLGDVEDIGTHARSRRVAAFGEALALSPHDAAPSPQEIGMLRALGRFLHIEARLDEAAVLERRAAAMAADRIEDDPRGALTAQLDLALTLHHAGAPEAEDVARDALRRLEARFGSDDLDVLTAKHNLASWDRGNKLEAQQLARQVFESRRRLLGADHPHTLFSLHSLLAHDVLPEPYPDFIAAYEDLIARRTRVLGADHTTTLTSVSNFVERLIRLERPAQALPLARRLVERRSALYGPDHVATLAAKSRLVLALSSMPEPPSSELETVTRELEAALAAMDRYSVYGPHFERTAEALAAACLALQQSGRPELAATLLERALPSVVQRLGPSSRTALVVEHNLAAALAANGELEAARRRFADLLARMLESLGVDDRLVLRARRQQALIEAGLGRVSHALDLLSELAEHWEARAGPDSPELAEACGDIADTLDRAGDASGARPFRQRQHAIASAAGAARANWV